MKWLASLALDRLIKFIYKLIYDGFVSLSNFLTNKSKRKTDEKNSQHYQDVLQNPNVTEQELDQATSDFLNGGKRD